MDIHVRNPRGLVIYDRLDNFDTDEKEDFEKILILYQYQYQY